MNIRHCLEYAEKFLEEGAIGAAEGEVSFVENYLKETDPDGILESPTICCFWTKGDIIHCGKTDEGPLFPGTREERFKLCKECRDWCREKIKELKEKIKKSKKE